MRITVALSVLVAAVALALTASASAQRVAGPELHDARYCEILELKGVPPDARIVVWNTIGLNECPAAKWDAIDAPALAAELGNTAVILNGPRHFLMDSATARTGRVRSFRGLRMRRVATIPIRTAADLVQAPYMERTIERDNTWVWEGGRRIYELLSPDGSTYVMQSYSQIRDHELAIGDLRDLGDRLDLPEGWRFRTRRLARDLTLTATGEATVVQDELQNTYQRVARKRGSVRRHRVDVSGTIRTVGSPEPGTLEDRGTVTGRPLAQGRSHSSRPSARVRR